MDEKCKRSLKNLGNAINRLNEALETNTDELGIHQDATIKRFEFCFELFWKTLKKLLFVDGVETTSPRDTLVNAYQYKLINDEKLWLSMLRDRNLSAHIYDQDTANEIYNRIKDYTKTLNDTYVNLCDKKK